MAKRASPNRGQDKRSRAADNTEHQERIDLDYYAPPNTLETPKDPEHIYRWVAEYVNGQQLPHNSVQHRIREGYERVRIENLPEDFIVDEDLRGDGFARTGGLILMRVHHRRHEARRQYFRNRSLQSLEHADELQGVAGRNAVREDRGTRSLTGSDAGRAIANMSQT